MVCEGGGWIFGSPLLALRVKHGDLRCASWRFMLACWPLRDKLTFTYYNILSNISHKKKGKGTFF